MMDKNRYCIIMAGGSGTRFWPLSRQTKPKQFQDIINLGQSFLQMTYRRFEKLVPKENILVITLSKYESMVKEQLPFLAEENLLLEPYARNTAPSIVYATYALLKRNPDATMIVAPSDHVIGDEEMFIETVNRSFEYAIKNHTLMTIGIVPDCPDINFGYIQVEGGQEACKGDKPVRVKTFTEKPDLELAKVFLKSGEFLWNSGMFVWEVRTIKEEMEKYMPQISSLFKSWEQYLGTKEERVFLEKAYSDCTKISIDYALMEKTDRAWICPAKFKWSDIGNWSSLYKNISEKDAFDNAINIENSFLQESRENMVHISDKKKLVAIKGLQNFIVVDTEDVLLICPKDNKSFNDLSVGLSTMSGIEDYK